MRSAHSFMAVLIGALALAGCGGFGASKPAPVETVDPNVFPSNYRQQIARLLATTLTQRADFHGTLIAAPVLKPVAEGTSPHYVACLKFASRIEHQTKAVIFLAGTPTQYVDATPQQCGDAAYQPFTELEAEVPAK